MNIRYAKIITEHVWKKKKCFHIMNLWWSLGIFGKILHFQQGMFVVTENTILGSQNRLGLIKGRDEHSQSGTNSIEHMLTVTLQFL